VTEVVPQRNPVELGRRRLVPRPVALPAVVLVLFAGLLGIPSGTDGRLLLAVGVLAALVGDAVIVRLSTRELSVRFEPPVEATADEEIGVLVEVTGVVRPVRVELPGTTPALSFTIDGSQPGIVRIPAPPRGVHPHIGLRLVVPGPFGLFEVTRRVRVWLATPLSVGPTPIAHQVDWPALRTVRFGITETAPMGRDLFRGVRPYAQGDPRRQVHWKSTAHHGRLMVKESEGTGVVLLRLVVSRPYPGAAAEAALGRAAWLGRRALEVGWRIDLVLIEPTGPVPSPPPVDAFFFLAIAPQPIRPGRQVHVQVSSVHELNARLALAGVGVPEVAPSTIATRLVTDEGDRWL
jgi:uncharacterized protein (DUF58 family)